MRQEKKKKKRKKKRLPPPPCRDKMIREAIWSTHTHNNKLRNNKRSDRRRDQLVWKRIAVQLRKGFIYKFT